MLEDPSLRLVRVDVVEAWARRLYTLQSLPGYTPSVRRAILCESDDGRAAYVEYVGVSWRLFRTKQWIGPLEALGRPRPAPAGFEIARGLRLYRVRERSMVLRIDGVDRIVSFTGEDLPEGGSRLRRWGVAAVNAGVGAIPYVGTGVDWTRTATKRLKPGSAGPQAVAAAAYWRRRLEAAVAPRPADLGLPPAVDFG